VTGDRAPGRTDAVILCGPAGRHIADADRRTVATFRELLHALYDQEQHDMTEPDPTPEAAEVDLNPVRGWVDVLLDCRAKKAALEEVEKQARQKIEKLMGDRVDGILDGKPVVRWHHVAASRRVDTKALRKAHPGIAAQYTKVGEPGRRFEVVEDGK
jgi:hypothetical protein